LTTSEPDEQAKTAPIELPTPAAPPPPESAAPTRPADHARGANQPPAASATPAEGLVADRALAGHAADFIADTSPAERAATPSADSSSATLATHAADPPWSEEPRSASAAPQVGALVARPATITERETLFVPLAVSIGDGFKFGCGFFLASVLVMLIGFVLLAALFVLTTAFGLNLPISR